MKVEFKKVKLKDAIKLKTYKIKNHDSGKTYKVKAKSFNDAKDKYNKMIVNDEITNIVKQVKSKFDVSATFKSDKNSQTLEITEWKENDTAKLKQYINQQLSNIDNFDKKGTNENDSLVWSWKKENVKDSLAEDDNTFMKAEIDELSRYVRNWDFMSKQERNNVMPGYSKSEGLTALKIKLAKAEASLKKDSITEDATVAYEIGYVGEDWGVWSNRSSEWVAFGTKENMTKLAKRLNESEKKQRQDSITEDADIAGWIAIYNGTRIEIKKSEADSLYSAKKLAILKFKEKFKNVKEHMISIAPGYNDSITEDASSIQIPKSSKEFERVIREYHKKYGKILQVESMIYDFETGKYYMYNESTDYSFTSKRLADSVKDAATNDSHYLESNKQYMTKLWNKKDVFERKYKVAITRQGEGHYIEGSRKNLVSLLQELRGSDFNANPFIHDSLTEDALSKFVQSYLSSKKPKTKAEQDEIINFLLERNKITKEDIPKVRTLLKIVKDSHPLKTYKIKNNDSGKTYKVKAKSFNDAKNKYNKFISIDSFNIDTEKYRGFKLYKNGTDWEVESSDGTQWNYDGSMSLQEVKKAIDKGLRTGNWEDSITEDAATNDSHYLESNKQYMTKLWNKKDVFERKYKVAITRQGEGHYIEGSRKNLVSLLQELRGSDFNANAFIHDSITEDAKIQDEVSYTKYYLRRIRDKYTFSRVRGMWDEEIASYSFKKQENIDVFISIIKKFVDFNMTKSELLSRGPGFVMSFVKDSVEDSLTEDANITVDTWNAFIDKHYNSSNHWDYAYIGDIDNVNNNDDFSRQEEKELQRKYKYFLLSTRGEYSFFTSESAVLQAVKKSWPDIVNAINKQTKDSITKDEWQYVHYKSKEERELRNLCSKHNVKFGPYVLDKDGFYKARIEGDFDDVHKVNNLWKNYQFNGVLEDSINDADIAQIDIKSSYLPEDANADNIQYLGFNELRKISFYQYGDNFYAHYDLTGAVEKIDKDAVQRILKKNIIGEIDEDILTQKQSKNEEIVKDSDYERYTLKTGRRSDAFKQYLRDRGLKFEPSQNGNYTEFVVFNTDESVDRRVNEIIKTISDSTTERGDK